MEKARREERGEQAAKRESNAEGSEGEGSSERARVDDDTTQAAPTLAMMCSLRRTAHLTVAPASPGVDWPPPPPPPPPPTPPPAPSSMSTIARIASSKRACRSLLLLLFVVGGGVLLLLLLLPLLPPPPLPPSASAWSAASAHMDVIASTSA
jgi:hypothetical protein